MVDSDIGTIPATNWTLGPERLIDGSDREWSIEIDAALDGQSLQPDGCGESKPGSKTDKKTQLLVPAGGKASLSNTF